jgi:tRNA(Ile2) C34 agmatinyltransferase TiaS
MTTKTKTAIPTVPVMTIHPTLTVSKVARTLADALTRAELVEMAEGMPYRTAATKLALAHWVLEHQPVVFQEPFEMPAEVRC